MAVLGRKNVEKSFRRFSDVRRKRIPERVRNA